MSYQHQGAGLLQVTSNKVYNIATIDDIFNEIERDEDQMRKDPVDSLAISCANYRSKEFRTKDAVVQIDYDTAKEIRDYYSKKLMVRSLKGKPLSKFRQDLSDYINKGYTNEYPEKYMGMIYKLPEFYYYDLEIDKLRIESSNEKIDTSVGVKRLNFLTKLYRSAKSTGSYVFWFNDENKNLYSIQILKENDLLELFQSICEFGTVTLSGKFLSLTKDDLNYCKICNPRLLFLKD